MSGRRLPIGDAGLALVVAGMVVLAFFAGLSFSGCGPVAGSPRAACRRNDPFPEPACRRRPFQRPPW